MPALLTLSNFSFSSTHLHHSPSILILSPSTQTFFPFLLSFMSIPFNLLFTSLTFQVKSSIHILFSFKFFVFSQIFFLSSFLSILTYTIISLSVSRTQLSYFLYLHFGFYISPLTTSPFFSHFSTLHFPSLLFLYSFNY